MDKELLFKPRLDEDVVDLEGLGEIRVRALSRDEVAEAREEATDRKGNVDLATYEYDLIAKSMLDPELTVEEVAEWSRAAPAGELVKVIEKIRDLSRLDEESSKSDVPGNRQQRRAALRARAR